MSDHFEIRSCSDSLARPGECCVCRAQATMAVLTKDLVEHARCLRHCTGGVEASKPLVWDPTWGPAA